VEAFPPGSGDAFTIFSEMKYDCVLICPNQTLHKAVYFREKGVMFHKIGFEFKDEGGIVGGGISLELNLKANF
jgi:hypothetical protein